MIKLLRNRRHYMRKENGYTTISKCSIDNNNHNVKNTFAAAKILGTYLQKYRVNYNRTAKKFKYSILKEENIINKYNLHNLYMISISNKKRQRRDKNEDAAENNNNNNNNNLIRVYLRENLTAQANYKVSTVTWIYTKITKEQDTKHDSLYNGNKLIIVPRKNKFSVNRREK
jgi:hypothetical protein